QEIVNTFFPTGWEQTRAIKKASGSPLAWSPVATIDWTYFDNGKLKTLNTANGSNAVRENHAVSYIGSDGLYDNGNRVQDTYWIVGPDTSAPCRSSTTTCIAAYQYDARDRVTSESDGHGDTTTYARDAAGNLLQQQVTGSHPSTVGYTYAGTQMQTQPNA